MLEKELLHEAPDLMTKVQKDKIEKAGRVSNARFSLALLCFFFGGGRSQ